MGIALRLKPNPPQKEIDSASYRISLSMADYITETNAAEDIACGTIQLVDRAAIYAPIRILRSGSGSVVGFQLSRVALRGWQPGQPLS